MWGLLQVVLERTNILHLQKLDDRQHNDIDINEVDLVTIDAGWTKLELVLPAIRKFLKKEGIIIALLKPHDEALKKDLIKGVLPPEKAEGIKNRVIEKIKELKFEVEEVMDSPILGGAGNKEFLLKISNNFW